jgi:hypothetical protein
VVGFAAAWGVAMFTTSATGLPEQKRVDYETPLIKGGFSICAKDTTGGNIIGAYEQPNWTVMTDKKPCPKPRPVTDSATDELSTR